MERHRPPSKRSFFGPMRFETERLILRSWTTDDLSSYIRLFSDPEVRRFLPAMPDPTPESAAASIARRGVLEATRGFTAWAVVRRDTGELIGNCGLQPVERVGPDIELAYHYVKSAWGNGYGTEAAIACLRQGLGPLGLDAVIAICFPENIGSWRIMEKSGMRYVGLTNEYYGLNGLKMYGADRATWRAPA